MSGTSPDVPEGAPDGATEAATGASDAVKGGAGEVGAVVQKLGGACKACHDDYREKS